ncbi:MAG: glycosyltransferase family 39 protein [Desulfovibrionaceae bacterium]|nr:glycosyltransferase family 39 protein [Desulfovibrionaceae bacterium]MBF0514581.1 glycosyltransferase family 39 protein [Desulfovibrionaceae bacterium]
MPQSATDTSLPVSWGESLRDPVLWAILLMVSFLLFYNLGGRPLWQDEAETANLGRNVLRFGLEPKVFDGLNVVSQEETREFGPDMVWRWSPWFQIYMSAVSQAVFGYGAAEARALFAVGGVLCVGLTYLLIRRRFGDKGWARMSAFLLAVSVPFLLFARMGRYYAYGGVLVLVTLFCFRGRWRDSSLSLAVLVLSLGLLFHANYLLFISYAPCLLLGALLLYRDELPLSRVALVGILTAILVVPGFFMYRLTNQGGMFNILVIPQNVIDYLADFFMYIVPLPVFAALTWRWLPVAFRGAPRDPGERFCLFLALNVVGAIAIMALIPQRFHRYMAHLYPWCAIILGWATVRLWRYFKPAGALLCILMAATNWLNVLPMEKLHIVNRPWQNDSHQLTWSNIPLRLFLTELVCGYPDVNAALIDFFNKNARPGEVILAEYGDMVLQYYTPFRIIGGLQGAIDPSLKPDWISVRHEVRVNRDRILFDSKAATMFRLDLDNDYDRIDLASADEAFGNREDPQYHYFIPLAEPVQHLVIYRKKGIRP